MFALFFFVIYAVLTYGLIFAAQSSLNFSAQEAARALLRWQPGATQGLTTRAQAALAAAQAGSSWVTAMGQGNVAIAVCGTTGLLTSSNGGACSGLALQSNQYEVVVDYPYGSNPLIPELPGIGLLVPALLGARAATVVDVNFLAPQDS